jgi:SWI/SNF-related matrix-associated actin-dependent regulator of chromatin subfamily A member 5
LTLDGNYESSNVYLFEGEDWREHQKNQQDFDFIQLPKRERAVNYVVAPLPKRDPKPKPKGRVFKPTNCQDFQFYLNPERLTELEFKEFTIQEQASKLPSEDDDDEEEAPVMAEMVPEEKDELQKLKLSGFSSWTRKDFQGFIKGCEKYGRKDLNAITTMGIISFRKFV